MSIQSVPPTYTKGEEKLIRITESLFQVTPAVGAGELGSETLPVNTVVSSAPTLSAKVLDASTVGVGMCESDTVRLADPLVKASEV
jgi:hypothetical protein